MKKLLLASLLVSATVAAPADAKPKPLKCASTGHTLASSKQARAFTYRTIAYACLRRRDSKIVRLGGAQACYSHVCDGVLEAKLAGHYVAYREDHVDPSTAYDSLVSRNLKTGRVVHSYRTATDSCNVIPQFVMNTSGSLAWIQQDCKDMFGGQQLQRWDSTGQAVLDSGQGISSLTLSGGKIYWTSGDQQRSADLK
jgi:hypothetical protein